MNRDNSVNGAWIRDSAGLWLSLPTSALRRLNILPVVGCRSKASGGFVYLDAESTQRVLSELEAQGVALNAAPPATRFSRVSPVHSMPGFSAIAA